MDLARKDDELYSTYALRYLTTYLKLSKFYNSRGAKKRTWDFKRATTREMHADLRSIVSMASGRQISKIQYNQDGSPRNPVQEVREWNKITKEMKEKMIFVLGNAAFDSK
jgi:hypothetical protein